MITSLIPDHVGDRVVMRDQNKNKIIALTPEDAIVLSQDLLDVAEKALVADVENESSN